eukprot:scaffold280133_cov23-Prasinocladus_malaysianus.AAC.2
MPGVDVDKQCQQSQHFNDPLIQCSKLVMPHWHNLNVAWAALMIYILQSFRVSNPTDNRKCLI